MTTLRFFTWATRISKASKHFCGWTGSHGHTHTHTYKHNGRKHPLVWKGIKHAFIIFTFSSILLTFD